MICYATYKTNELQDPAMRSTNNSVQNVNGEMATPHPTVSHYVNIKILREQHLCCTCLLKSFEFMLTCRIFRLPGANRQSCLGTTTNRIVQCDFAMPPVKLSTALLAVCPTTVIADAGSANFTATLQKMRHTWDDNMQDN